MRRQFLLLSLCIAALFSGCGFALRQAPSFAFNSIYVAVPDNSAMGAALKHDIGSSGKVQVITDANQISNAQVTLEVLADQRDKVVLSMSPVGQVREFQLRVLIKFRLRTADSKELIPATEIMLQRSFSYSESAALAKETEENLLYRDMQSDVVQQVMRRLAAVKTL
jgi:LPS-assembly lipoprotein